MLEAKQVTMLLAFQLRLLLRCIVVFTTNYLPFVQTLGFNARGLHFRLIRPGYLEDALLFIT
jgi:hypothetical protein